MIARTEQEINSLSQEFDAKLRGKRITKIFTIFGILNHALYIAGRQVKVISDKHGSKGLRDYNQKNINDLVQPLSVSVKMEGIMTYLSKYWEGHCYTAKGTVDKVRHDLSEIFKLYNLEDRRESRKIPKNRNKQPNVMTNFDAVAALILAERCELILLQHYSLEELQLDWSQEIGNGNYPTVRDESKSLPEHKAYTLVALFNMVFTGIVRWGRRTESASDRPLPDVVQIVNTNFKVLQAEQALDRLQDEQPDRPPEEILATESFDFVEPEVVVSNGLAILVDRLIARIPLASVIRRSMKVPPAPRVKVEKEASVTIPTWALEETEVAITWWEQKLGKTELWLSEMAPSWVLDAVLPF
ncbi:hypothetical protein QT972_26880 [Microcoleus sp. herbarium7]|uniref:hypothetical protein n=1 Tax=Microcoleus sp. herbarium7 TaxID=3055435 RepID=UPI002FD48CB8